MDLTLQAGFGTYGFIVSRYCVCVNVNHKTLCCTLSWTEPCCLTDAQGLNMPHHTHSAYLLWRAFIFQKESGNVIILKELWIPFFLCWWQCKFSANQFICHFTLWTELNNSQRCRISPIQIYCVQRAHYHYYIYGWQEILGQVEYSENIHQICIKII